jgi:hypothetical protein
MQRNWLSHTHTHTYWTLYFKHSECLSSERTLTRVLLLMCRYARDVGAVHVYTSAKLDRGVDECFLSLAKQMLSLHGSNTRAGAGGAGAGRPGAILIEDDPEDMYGASGAGGTARKDGCC